jgi:hypothetical protein
MGMITYIPPVIAGMNSNLWASAVQVWPVGYAGKRQAKETLNKSIQDLSVCEECYRDVALTELRMQKRKTWFYILGSVDGASLHHSSLSSHFQ